MLDVHVLRKDLARRRARLVAFDGRGGSGKWTLARQLTDAGTEPSSSRWTTAFPPSAESSAYADASARPTTISGRPLSTRALGALSITRATSTREDTSSLRKMFRM
jgi:hypothetical protein